MSECKIVSIDNDESSFSPKIVNFQNGQLLSNKVNELQCAAFTDSINHATIMTVATNKMVYVGEEKNNNDLFYTLLTIKCKKTNKIRLVPINTISLNVHIPKINGLLDSTLNDTVLNMKNLYKTFGSKKVKRRTEQRERMQLNVSSVEEELQQTVAAIQIKPDEIDLAKDDDNAKSYRPAINRDATNVAEVYDINDIITQAELDSLDYLAEEVLKNDFGEDKLTSFVVENLKIVKETTKDQMRKCQILLYIDAILKFFKTPIKMLKKNFSMDPYPVLIIEKLLDQFTILNGAIRLRPLSMRDKAICSVIILSFYVLDFKVDLEPLSMSIGCGIKKLIDISKMLGAHLFTRSSTIIVLSLPLPPPPVSLFRRKRLQKS